MKRCDSPDDVGQMNECSGLSTGSYVHHNGDWVRFEDVVQRIAELEAENKQLKEGLNYAGRRIIMVTVVIIVLLVNGHGGGW